MADTVLPALVTVGISSGLLLLMILLVVLLLYYRNPQFCHQLCSKTRQYPNHPPAFTRCTQRNTGEDPPGGSLWIQDSRIFCVGPPSSYQLPSYESIREKDWQRGIHNLGMEKSGGQCSSETEAPPCYEEVTTDLPPSYYCREPGDV
ncbi:uncharacterized protein WCC33_016489 [Rhinophrynus dorsalis]